MQFTAAAHPLLSPLLQPSLALALPGSLSIQVIQRTEPALNHHAWSTSSPKLTLTSSRLLGHSNVSEAHNSSTHRQRPKPPEASTSPRSPSQPSDSPSFPPTQPTAGKSPSTPNPHSALLTSAQIRTRPRISCTSAHSVARTTSSLACRFGLLSPVPPIRQHLSSFPLIQPQWMRRFCPHCDSCNTTSYLTSNSTSTHLFSPLPVRNKSSVTRDQPRAGDRK